MAQKMLSSTEITTSKLFASKSAFKAKTFQKVSSSKISKTKKMKRSKNPVNELSLGPLQVKGRTSINLHVKVLMEDKSFETAIITSFGPRVNLYKVNTSKGAAFWVPHSRLLPSDAEISSSEKDRLLLQAVERAKPTKLTNNQAKTVSHRKRKREEREEEFSEDDNISESDKDIDKDTSENFSDSEREEETSSEEEEKPRISSVEEDPEFLLLLQKRRKFSHSFNYIVLDLHNHEDVLSVQF